MGDAVTKILRNNEEFQGNDGEEELLGCVSRGILGEVYWEREGGGAVDCCEEEGVEGKNFKVVQKPKTRFRRNASGLAWRLYLIWTRLGWKGQLIDQVSPPLTVTCPYM
jgi:hypothetical protein